MLQIKLICRLNIFKILNKNFSNSRTRYELKISEKKIQKELNKGHKLENSLIFVR